MKKKVEETGFLKEFIMFCLVFGMSIPFWIFYKNPHYEIVGLIGSIILSAIFYNLGKEIKYIYVERQLYLTLIMVLSLIYFRIL